MNEFIFSFRELDIGPLSIENNLHGVVRGAFAQPVALDVSSNSRVVIRPVYEYLLCESQGVSSLA